MSTQTIQIDFFSYVEAQTEKRLLLEKQISEKEEGFDAVAKEIGNIEQCWRHITDEAFNGDRNKLAAEVQVSLQKIRVIAAKNGVDLPF